MGRTYTNKKEYDDWDKSSTSKKTSKHSRNISGKGMRVINNMSEDDYDDYDNSYDDTYDENTTTYTVKKGK